MTEQPWYREGLRFQCSQCGNCCTGSPGYVWVNKDEIAKMAVILDFDVKTFEKKYVRLVGIRKSLIEYANGDCVFFDNVTRKCKVYHGRPRQCRTWPFWDSNVRTPGAWAQTCVECPGSDKGKLHQLGVIEKQRTVIKI